VLLFSVEETGEEKETQEVCNVLKSEACLTFEAPLPVIVRARMCAALARFRKELFYLFLCTVNQDF